MEQYLLPNTHRGPGPTGCWLLQRATPTEAPRDVLIAARPRGGAIIGPTPRPPAHYIHIVPTEPEPHSQRCPRRGCPSSSQLPNWLATTLSEPVALDVHRQLRSHMPGFEPLSARASPSRPKHFPGTR
ncbi:hypothetical protein VUR80DRAFT_564 [Thermomyces stellatus]